MCYYFPFKPFTSYNSVADAAAKTTTDRLSTINRAITFIADNNTATGNNPTDKSLTQSFSKTITDNIIQVADNNPPNKNNAAGFENNLSSLSFINEIEKGNTSPSVNIFTPELLSSTTVAEENKNASYDNNQVEIKKVDLEQQLTGLINTDDKFTLENNNTLSIKENTQQAGRLTDTQKAWIENYALYNRPLPRNWNGKLSWQAHFTPSIVYRKLYSNTNEKLAARSNSIVRSDVSRQVTQMPSYGLEAGAGVQYS